MRIRNRGQYWARTDNGPWLSLRNDLLNRRLCSFGELNIENKLVKLIGVMTYYARSILNAKILDHIVMLSYMVLHLLPYLLLLVVLFRTFL